MVVRGVRRTSANGGEHRLLLVRNQQVGGSSPLAGSKSLQQQDLYEWVQFNTAPNDLLMLLLVSSSHTGSNLLRHTDLLGSTLLMRHA